MKNIKIILRYFKKFKIKKRNIFVAFLAGLLGSLLFAISPVFYGQMIDGLMNRKIDIISINLILFVLFNIGHSFFYIINNIYVIKSYRFLYTNIQNKISDKLSDFKEEEFEDNVQARLTNVISDSIDDVSNLADDLTDMAIVFLTTIVSFVILFNYSFISGLLILLINIISLTLYERANIKAEKYESNWRVKKDRLVNTIFSIFSNKKYLKKIKTKYEKEASELMVLKVKSKYNWVYRAIILPMVQEIMKGLFIVYLIIIYLNSEIGLDSFVVIMTYYVTINDNIVYFVDLFTRLKFANVSMDRIESIT